MKTSLSLTSFIFDKLRQFPDSIGLKVGDEQFYYQDIIKYSLFTASVLKHLGVKKEAVGLIGQRSPSSYFGILGIIFSGSHYVPINLKYSLDKQVKIIQDSRIRILVGSSEDLESFSAALDKKSRESIEAWIIPHGQSNLTDEKWFSKASLDNIPILKEPESKDASNLAYIMYTSGSTGHPKGVLVSQDNLLAWLKNMNLLYCMDRGFRASQTYDLSFDLSVADMFFTFSNHGTLCVLSEKELLFPIDYIIRENIEYWSSVPTLIAFMYKMGVLKPNVFPSIKKSIFCGEAIPKYLADAWKIAAPNSSIENLYGPTEATIWLTRYVYEEQDGRDKFHNNNLPIGKPFEDHDVVLIDADDNIVEGSNRGEIIYRGPQITLGYINDKAKTDAAFTKFKWDPKQSIWYRSGDIGCYNLNGLLECLGRKDNQIKLGGRRIEIAEIELSLRPFPLLDDLVVVPLKDKENRVLELVGFTTNIFSAEELKTIKLKSLDYLEAIFFPKRVFEIERFPVNTSGKLDRKSLVEMAKTLVVSDKNV